MALIELLSSSLTDLVNYPFDANKRLYIGYVLGAIVLALPVYWLGQQQRSAVGFMRFLFPKAIYLSSSAKHDYALLILNKLLKAALLVPLMFTMVPVALSVSGGLEQLFGVIEPITENQAVVIAAFTLLLFLFDDFTRYLLHLVLHKVPFLWEFHKVHHSARVMTPFTIYRSHPVETYLYGCRMALAQGVAVGLGYYFLVRR